MPRWRWAAQRPAPNVSPSRRPGACEASALAEDRGRLEKKAPTIRNFDQAGSQPHAPDVVDRGGGQKKWQRRCRRESEGSRERRNARGGRGDSTSAAAVDAGASGHTPRPAGTHKRTAESLVAAGLQLVLLLLLLLHRPRHRELRAHRRSRPCRPLDAKSGQRRHAHALCDVPCSARHWNLLPAASHLCTTLTMLSPGATAASNSGCQRS